ncbi:MAG: hypothetical protein HQL21_02955 [Candidatus Omnitrophica bacterium]|nr:hypothetical protein [Candidatus Omnitrophota bacterium]
MVVISIIAVLIGISIPRFKGMQEEASIAAIQAELASFDAAAKAYMANHHGQLPE